MLSPHIQSDFVHLPILNLKSIGCLSPQSSRVFADSEEMGLSVRSSLYPFLSHVRMLRFLSSSLSLPITPFLSVTDMPVGGGAHPLSLFRHEDAEHGEMVQEANGKPGLAKDGGC